MQQAARHNLGVAGLNACDSQVVFPGP